MCNAHAPHRCPSCGKGLVVMELSCPECDTRVKGNYLPCPVCTLTGENRKLFHLFLESRGNLKEMQRRLGVSYPTVRIRVEEMFQGLAGAKRHPLEILEDLHAGVISVEEAVGLLEGNPDPEREDRPCEE